jgi:hypothetical protein
MRTCVSCRITTVALKVIRLGLPDAGTVHAEAEMTDLGIGRHERHHPSTPIRWA